MYLGNWKLPRRLEVAIAILLIVVGCAWLFVKVEQVTGTYFVFGAQLGYPSMGFEPVSKNKNMTGTIPCFARQQFYPDLSQPEEEREYAYALPWTCRNIRLRLPNGVMIPQQTTMRVSILSESGSYLAEQQDLVSFMNETDTPLQLCLKGPRDRCVQLGSHQETLIEVFGTDVVTWTGIAP